MRLFFAIAVFTLVTLPAFAVDLPYDVHKFPVGCEKTLLMACDGYEISYFHPDAHGAIDHRTDINIFISKNQTKKADEAKRLADQYFQAGGSH